MTFQTGSKTWMRHLLRHTLRSSPIKSPIHLHSESRSRFSGFTPIHRGRQERNRRDSKQLGLRKSGKMPDLRVEPFNSLVARFPSRGYGGARCPAYRFGSFRNRQKNGKLNSPTYGYRGLISIGPQTTGNSGSDRLL